jgi:hypothetical protein
LRNFVIVIWILLKIFSSYPLIKILWGTTNIWTIIWGVSCSSTSLYQWIGRKCFQIPQIFATVFLPSYWGGFSGWKVAWLSVKIVALSSAVKKSVLFQNKSYLRNEIVQLWDYCRLFCSFREGFAEDPLKWGKLKYYLFILQ